MPWKQVYGDQNANNTQTASATQSPTPGTTGNTPTAGTGR